MRGVHGSAGGGFKPQRAARASLEFVAARLPAAFLGGGTAAGVDLARLAETAAYVVMQVAAPCRGCE